MDFDGFDWDDGNRGKCRKHGLSLDEIEDVFARSVLILPDPGNSQKGAALPGDRNGGIRPQGLRGLHDPRRPLRPISARYMHEREVTSYEETYPDLRDR